MKARVTDYIHEKKLTEAVLRERQEELTALEIQRRKIANKQVEQFRERVSSQQCSNFESL